MHVQNHMDEIVVITLPSIEGNQWEQSLIMQG